MPDSAATEVGQWLLSIDHAAQLAAKDEELKAARAALASASREGETRRKADARAAERILHAAQLKANNDELEAQRMALVKVQHAAQLRADDDELNAKNASAATAQWLLSEELAEKDDELQAKDAELSEVVASFVCIRGSCRRAEGELVASRLELKAKDAEIKRLFDLTPEGAAVAEGVAVAGRGAAVAASRKLVAAPCAYLKGPGTQSSVSLELEDMKLLLEKDANPHLDEYTRFDDEQMQRRANELDDQVLASPWPLLPVCSGQEGLVLQNKFLAEINAEAFVRRVAAAGGAAAGAAARQARTGGRRHTARQAALSPGA